MTDNAQAWTVYNSLMVDPLTHTVYSAGEEVHLPEMESPAIEMVIKKRYLLNWADTASVYPVTDHIAHKVYILGRSILHEAHP